METGQGDRKHVFSFSGSLGLTFASEGLSRPFSNGKTVFGLGLRFPPQFGKRAQNLGVLC